MFDELFEGSPQAKCFEIIFGANPSVVSTQLDAVFSELASFRFESENEGRTPSIAELDEVKNDLYIELVSNILSNNE